MMQSLSSEQVIDLLTLLASVGSLIGSFYLYKESSQPSSVFVKSDLGLPFYFAGIIQWLLFGVFSHNFILIVTCGLQIPFLSLGFRHYLRARFK